MVVAVVLIAATGAVIALTLVAIAQHRRARAAEARASELDEIARRTGR